MPLEKYEFNSSPLIYGLNSKVYWAFWLRMATSLEGGLFGIKTSNTLVKDMTPSLFPSDMG